MCQSQSYETLLNLKQHLQRCGVALAALPPFALSPENVANLRDDKRVYSENIGQRLGHGVFTVVGLRVVRADGITQTGEAGE